MLDSTHSTTRRSAASDIGPAVVDTGSSPGAHASRHGPVHAVVATAVVTAMVVHAVTDGSVLADVVYVSVIIGSAIGAWRVVALTPTDERLAPRLVAGGLTLTALGDSTWRYLQHHGYRGDVSPADLAWWGSYVALGAAVWVVLGRGRGERGTDVDSVLDVVTILVVGVVVLWRTSIEVVVTDEHLSVLTRWVWASYPVADAALLALVVRALATRRTREGLSPRFLGGVGLWLAADLATLQWTSVPVVNTLMDSAWMLAPVLIASARWRPTPTPTPDDGSARVEHGAPVLALALAVVPLIVAPAMEVVADLTDQPDRPDQLIISTVLLAALALVRTGRLLRSERRALDEAVEASEAKSVFLANVGHEIRTPLTTVLASAELLDDSDLDPLQRRMLERMQRNGELLKGLVERILDLSALTSGEVVLRPTTFDPSELVTGAVAAHADRARARGLELTSYVDPTAPATVVADRVRVFQVLTNLVDNALKFTEEGGIRLELHSLADVTVFRVVDTGIGIRAGDQDVVFDLFRQVDGSMTRAYGGTGMGLTISRELARAMGGAVTMASSPGIGSTFELHLPRDSPR